MLKRLLIWTALLSTWEAAYRVAGWKSYIFPAPSHVLDGTLAMLRVETALGDPLSRPGWPAPAKASSDAYRQGLQARTTGQTAADNPYTGRTATPTTASSVEVRAADWQAGFDLAHLAAPRYRAARKTIEALFPLSAHPDDDLLRLPRQLPATIEASTAKARGFADACRLLPASANPFRREIADAEAARSAAETDWRRGFEAGGQRWYASPLIEALLVSVARLAVGFLLSIVIGAVIGALAWRFKAIDEFVGPLLLGVQTLPSVCWVPLAIILFGIDERAMLFVLTMGSFSAVAIALRDGLRAIPPLYQQAGRMMGARGLKLYGYVLLPASMPALATSLRQGFSFAWRSLMGAELLLVVYYHGLGHLLSVGRDMNAVEQVVAVLVIMILIGILADRWVFAPLQRRVNRRFGLSPAGT